MRAEFLYAAAGASRGVLTREMPVSQWLIALSARKSARCLWCFTALGPPGWQTFAAARVIFAADWLNRTHDSAPLQGRCIKTGLKAGGIHRLGQ